MWVSVKDQTKTIKVNTDFIILLDPEEYSLMLSSGYTIPLSLEDYQALELKMFPKRNKPAKDDTELSDFLNELHKLLGRTGTIALTGDRRKGIATLLKEGFTKEQIVTAATNIGKSEWMRGKNDRGVNYAKVDYLFRKSDKTTWNINKWQEEQVKKQNNLF